MISLKNNPSQMTPGIKEFIEDFFKAEAISFDTHCKIQDLAAVNAAYHKMHTYTVDALEGMLGQTYMSQLRDESYYASTKSYSPSIPRHLFKIALYHHPQYKEVWVAYASPSSPYEDFKNLSNAFFVIKKEDEFKVGSHHIYSNERGMSHTFAWEWIAGLTALNFDTLGELIEVERYQEPFDIDDNMKIYLEDK